MDEATTGPEPMAETEPTPAQPAVEVGDTSWVKPDPPPIPDRIQKKVSPRRRLRRSDLPKIRLAVFKKRYVALLAGGVALIALTFWLTRPNEFSEQQQEQWAQLCLDYHNWFERFSQSVEQGNRLVLREAGLGDVLAEVGVRESHPRAIADQGRSVSLIDLAKDPPPHARRRASIVQMRLSTAAVERVQKEFEDWHVLHGLKSAAKSAQAAGWPGVANYLESVIAMNPPKSGVPVGDAIRTMQRALEQADSLLTAEAELTRIAKVLDSYDDAVLSSWAGQASEPVAAGFRDQPELNIAQREQSFLSLLESANTQLAYGRRLLAAVEGEAWDRINHEALREHGKSYAMLAEAEHEPVEVMRTWLTEVGHYQAMTDDWRPGWAETQREKLKSIHKKIAALQAQDDRSSKTLLRKHEALAQRVTDVLEAPAVKGQLAKLQTERVVINGAVSDLASAVAGFAAHQQAGQRIEQLKEIEHIGDTAVRSEVVDAWWIKHRDRLISRAQMTGEAEGMWREANQTRDTLRQLIDPANSETAFKPTQGYEAGEADPLTQALIASLTTAAAEAREAGLKNALQNGINIDAQGVADARQAYNSTLTYNSTLNSYSALITLARDIQTFYHGLYRLDDEAFSLNGQGLVKRVAKVAGESDKWPEEVRNASEPVLDRVAAVVALGKIDEWSTLARVAIEADNPVISFNAWRRMGEVSWPLHAKTLEVEWQVHERFAPVLMSIRDTPRRQALMRELRDNGKRRWARAMESAQSDDEVEGLVPLMRRFGVELDALSPRAGFNVTLSQAKKATKTPTNKVETAAVVAPLLHTAQALPANPAITELAKELQQLTGPEARPLEALMTAGPATAGWETQPINEHSVVYTRGDQQLTFVRVSPANGSPFYIASHEVSAGVALDAMNHGESWKRFSALLPIDTDADQGPSAWARTTPGQPSKLRIQTQDWLSPDASYPDSLRHDPPTPRHPIQRIPPATASLIAESLGCTLPSVEQWQLALAAHPIAPGSLPNLRDTTWARYAIHLAKSQGTEVDAAPGVFLPKGYPGDPGNLAEHHQVNDGRLWFGPQPRAIDARPSHLVGNVAEWVINAPINTESLTNDSPADPTQRVTAFNQANADRFAVIGGSALSPPDLVPERAYPVDLSQANQGYSDVGFRLVFTPKRIEPTQRVSQLLADQPYLLPAKP